MNKKIYLGSLGRDKIYRDLAIYFFCALSLVIISTFKLLGNDQDITVYFKFLKYGNFSEHAFRFEPMTYLIKELSFGNLTIFFFIFSLFGVGLKFIAFYRLSASYIFVAVCYAMTYFFLHEYTQIRAGIASGILLLSIPDIANKNFKGFLFKALIAISFHYSAVIMIPLYFIVLFNQVWLFLLLPLVGLVIAIVDPPIYKLVVFITSLHETLLSLFRSKQGHSDYVSLFSFLQISYLLSFYSLAILVYKFNKIDVILYRVYSIALFLYYVTIPLRAPVITYRLSELLFVCGLVCIANSSNYMKYSELVRVVVILYFSVFFYYYIFILKLI